MLVKNQKINLILRILVGVFFLISSISKLITIDSFEVYLYGFGVFGLNFSFLVARLVIGVELLFGLLITLGIYSKKIAQAAIVMLIAFSIFLTFLLFTNNSEHCHCFGDLIEMSHGTSILKNIVLITLLIFISKNNRNEIRFTKLFFFIIIVASTIIPFIISPPDSFSYQKYSTSVSYNEDLLQDFIKKNSQYTKGKKVLCFFGTGCRFCKLAAKKISVIADNLSNKNKVNYVFWGTQESTDNFFQETNSKIFPYSFLSADKFLRITDGKMPLIILLEDGAVKGKYNYRGINDAEIIQFIYE